MMVMMVAIIIIMTMVVMMMYLSIAVEDFTLAIALRRRSTKACALTHLDIVMETTIYEL